MGNCLHPKTIFDTEPSLASSRPIFEALQLSPHDTGRLFREFSLFDKDKSGFISTHELFAGLAKDSTNFRDRVFALFDEDNSGQIDFREFVLTLWNYCTLSKSSLVVFAFDLYDTDGTGILSMKEVDEMLVDLYGEQAKSHPQALKIRKELNHSRFDIPITVKVFRSFVQNHPALLFPAFQMQLGLQEHVLGRSFWEKCSKSRVQLSNGREVNIGALSDWNVRSGENKSSIHPSTGNKDSNDSGEDVAHPRDEMAQIILRSTGTLHHRRLVKRATKFVQYSPGHNTQGRTASTEKSARKAVDKLLSDVVDATPPPVYSPRPKSQTTATAVSDASAAASSSSSASPAMVGSRSDGRLSGHQQHRANGIGAHTAAGQHTNNSPMVSPRPHSQAEEQVFEHFFTPKHLLPSVQQQYLLHQQEEHHQLHQHRGHHNHHHQSSLGHQSHTNSPSLSPRPSAASESAAHHPPSQLHHHHHHDKQQQHHHHTTDHHHNHHNHHQLSNPAANHSPALSPRVPKAHEGQHHHHQPVHSHQHHQHTDHLHHHSHPSRDHHHRA